MPPLVVGYELNFQHRDHPRQKRDEFYYFQCLLNFRGRKINSIGLVRRRIALLSLSAAIDFLEEEEEEKVG